VRPADVDESPRPGELPRDLVLRLALAKARAVCRPGEMALGADTIVALDDEPLGKPADVAEATRMLSGLSNRRHTVWTGVALVTCAGFDGGSAFEAIEVCRTDVVFRNLGASEITAYVASGEPFDRAGAYAIQGGAASFVALVDGDYDNVVGLPIRVVTSLLGRAGINRRP
jgi:septum formation protein